MTAIAPFSMEHTTVFNNVNIDRLTETYGLQFYGHYVTEWGEFQRVATHGPTGVVSSYVLGKAEGGGEDWHGHVSAVSVAPTFRRLRLGHALMHLLEDTSANLHGAYFVDLFVRKSNAVAQRMYKGMEYVAYRTVLGYYQGRVKSEDALDMRRALPRNARRSVSAVIPQERPIYPHELTWN
jgi:N-terminal acetyltransferase B complex catalytic subunit